MNTSRPVPTKSGMFSFHFINRTFAAHKRTRTKDGTFLTEDLIVQIYVYVINAGGEITLASIKVFFLSILIFFDSMLFSKDILNARDVCI